MRRRTATSGQSSVEAALILPLVMMMVFGTFSVGRLFYIYHTLQKAMRGGVEYALRAQGVNFCDLNDPVLFDAKNIIVYGNLQGAGDPVVGGLTTDMIQFIAERGDPNSSVVNDCGCADNGCDITSGGRPPDFVTVNLGGGLPVNFAVPFLKLGTISVRVSVRQPFLGA